MRLTVLQQQTKALQQERPETGAEVSKRLESVKHLLWYGNTEEALERLGDLLMDAIRGVDDQPSGQQTIRQEAADAVDATGRPSFAADQDEGHQRGSGRPIPPLVSEIQAAGARAQGGLTPDFLALSNDAVSAGRERAGCAHACQRSKEDLLHRQR